MHYVVNSEKIQAEALKKIAEEEKKAAIYNLLPESLAAFNLLVMSTSYSADMLVKVEGNRYPYDSPKPNGDTLRELAAAFPPVAVKRLRTHGSLTFLPVPIYDQWSEAEKEKKVTEETEVSPFLVQIEPASYGQTCTVEWFSQTPSGILEVNVVFALSSVREWLGTSEVQYSKYFGGQKVKENRFVPKMETIGTLYDGEGTPVAQLASPIRWASGSTETPGKFTLYWEPFAETLTPLEALFRMVR